MSLLEIKYIIYSTIQIIESQKQQHFNFFFFFFYGIFIHYKNSVTGQCLNYKQNYSKKVFAGAQFP